MDGFFNALDKWIEPRFNAEYQNFKKAFNTPSHVKTLKYAADKLADVQIELEKVKKELSAEQTMRVAAETDLAQVKSLGAQCESRLVSEMAESERLRKLTQTLRDSMSTTPQQVELLSEAQTSLEVALKTAQESTYALNQEKLTLDQRMSSYQQIIQELNQTIRDNETRHENKTRELLKLLTSVNAQRRLDFLPCVVGRSFRDVTLNSYLQFIRKNEQMYLEQSATLLTDGHANCNYDNKCIGALSLLTPAWCSKYFIEPLHSLGFAHHYAEFMHFRIVMSNASECFSELLTVINLNGVVAQKSRYISVSVVKDLSQQCGEPRRQFTRAIEIFDVTFKRYQNLFIQYLSALRESVEPNKLEFTLYKDLPSDFFRKSDAAILEQRNNVDNILKRKRMDVDGLIAKYKI